MTDKLYKDFGKQIENLTLVSSSGGAYEVDVDGTIGLCGVDGPVTSGSSGLG